ncbi:DUF1176 domain-containing protein [Microbulbifer sp.]|uniref:DUF1176 domain-containing protein n=1 Tax=Microbulbifer sp. TaxID=1908541 RepID=UPI003F2CA64A
MISNRNFALVIVIVVAAAVVAATYVNPMDKADSASTDGFPAELRDSHGECRHEELPEGLEPTTHPLGAGRLLHIVPCWAGAYNLGSLVFVTGAKGEEPQLVTFDEYLPDGKRTRTEVLVNAAFNPESGVLTSFNKARGIGDCGSMGKWLWRAGTFQLVEFRARECGGEPVESSEWPVLYRAQE